MVFSTMGLHGFRISTTVSNQIIVNGYDIYLISTRLWTVGSGKWFKPDKVGIMTSGVRASVHHYNKPKRSLPNIPNPDHESLAQSIAYLLLNHQDEDTTDIGNVFQQADAVVNSGINNEDDLHDHLADNILNDVDVDDWIVAGVVNDGQNNVVGGEPVLDHFVNVGVDPVTRLNLTGMSFFFCFLISCPCTTLSNYLLTFDLFFISIL